jgi:nucleoside-diphosphate-sugar epimerase
MRIFLAGATGAVGKRLVPLLVQSGHEVTGMTRSPAKTEGLRAAGAEPVVGDALDGRGVMDAVAAARPDVVIHEATDLSSLGAPRNIDRAFAGTNALRTTGTENLLAAARAAGARRFLAQSFAGWPYAKVGGPVKTEEDPLDDDPPKGVRATLAAVRRLEEITVGDDEVEGVALRYGGFYGPGTSLTRGGTHWVAVQKRRFPIVGAGTGVWSFAHIDDVARATALAAERGAPGVYNIVDDEPAQVSEFLPVLADAIGAKPPRHVPEWLGRLLSGEAGVAMMTTIRGASNAKAKRELGWEPLWPSWRDGFRRGLEDPSAALGAAGGDAQGLAADQPLEASDNSP